MDFLESFFLGATQTTLIWHLSHIEKIFYNLSLFDKQARTSLKKCLYKVKLASLRSTESNIKQDLKSLYNRLLQSYYLDLTDRYANYLEINLLEPSVIKSCLNSSDELRLCPLFEVIKLTEEEEKKLIAQTDKLTQKLTYTKDFKTINYKIESRQLRLYLYFSKMFFHSCLDLQEESESILKEMTSLLKFSHTESKELYEISVCVRLWRISHCLFYKNFTQSGIYCDELLEFIEPLKTLAAFKDNHSFLEQAEALTLVNRDFAVKANKFTAKLSLMSSATTQEKNRQRR